MKLKKKTAAPNAFSGQNYNTPVQIWDTHPNRRFAVGEDVIPVDPSDVPITGQVVGHCAEDRLWVRWAHGLVTQEDVFDVIAKREYSLDSSRVDRVSYDSSSADERGRQAGKTAEHHMVSPRTHPSTIQHMMGGMPRSMDEFLALDSIQKKYVVDQIMKNPQQVNALQKQIVESQQDPLYGDAPMQNSGAGVDPEHSDSVGMQTDQFQSFNSRGAGMTRSDAYVGLRGAGQLARTAGFEKEARAIEAARLVAESLEIQFGNRPKRIASSVTASQALVNASDRLACACKSLKASDKPEAVQAALAAERFFTASVTYDPYRKEAEEDNDKIVDEALKDAQEVLPFKKGD